MEEEVGNGPAALGLIAMAAKYRDTYDTRVLLLALKLLLPLVMYPSSFSSRPQRVSAATACTRQGHASLIWSLPVIFTICVRDCDLPVPPALWRLTKMGRRCRVVLMS